MQRGGKEEKEREKMSAFTHESIRRHSLSLRRKRV